MLRIMTLNINYYMDKHGPWNERRDLICQIIEHNKPDIIALQAVKKDLQVEDGIDQATQIAGLMPKYAQIIFEPAMVDGNGGAAGSAFLSRTKMRQIDRLELTLLPGLEDDNQRVLLRGLYDSPAGSLWVMNAHFSWVYQQGKMNIEQTMPFLPPHDQPAVLVGDFNMTPEMDLLDRLREAGWVDSWERLQPGKDGFTFEAPHPSIRIDYAWVSPGLVDKMAAIQVLSHERVEKNARLSDHLALLIDIEI
jgi:endonuclease/exonuclease/phosphatase family metal-dependent hydrolase